MALVTGVDAGKLKRAAVASMHMKRHAMNLLPSEKIVLPSAARRAEPGACGEPAEGIYA
jgi:uncharacterized low-complexity protein